MPPTLVADESVPSVLLGVLVGVSLVLPLHAPSSMPPSSKAAEVRPKRECRIKGEAYGKGNSLVYELLLNRGTGNLILSTS
jgi:hypothetical protein